LKAPDALHVAVARRTGLVLLSFDSVMRREATTLGVALAP
jgi:predicted nucleic acid-binding protein